MCVPIITRSITHTHALQRGPSIVSRVNHRQPWRKKFSFLRKKESFFQNPSKPVKTHQNPSKSIKNPTTIKTNRNTWSNQVNYLMFWENALLPNVEKKSTGELRKWPFHWPQKSWTFIQHYITKVVALHDQLWWDESAKVCRGKPSRTSDTNAAREVLSSSLDKEGPQNNTKHAGTCVPSHVTHLLIFISWASITGFFLSV